MRAIVSGGAPLAPHVEEFLKVVMCAPVVQGYGLTESCAASFIATPDDIKHAGTVGQAQPVTTFCLESVPEMKYDALANPPRGELLLKGTNNFSGYYKSDDKTVCILLSCFCMCGRSTRPAYVFGSTVVSVVSWVLSVVAYMQMCAAVDNDCRSFEQAKVGLDAFVI